MECGGTDWRMCSNYLGLDPKLETLKIETHCSERRFGWRVALDKVEGFVKAQNTCAVREHRDDRQRG